MKNKFHIIGIKSTAGLHPRTGYHETKSTLKSAIRKAQRYLNKRNCIEVWVYDCEDIPVISLKRIVWNKYI